MARSGFFYTPADFLYKSDAQREREALQYAEEQTWKRDLVQTLQAALITPQAKGHTTTKPKPSVRARKSQNQVTNPFFVAQVKRFMKGKNLSVPRLADLAAPTHGADDSTAPGSETGMAVDHSAPCGHRRP
jgi:hypothetical protein